MFNKRNRLAHTKQLNANVQVFVAMRKYVCAAHLTHVYICHTFRESQIRDSHRGLSDICILSSQNWLTFKSIYDSISIAAAELERHGVQNSRDNQYKLPVVND